jgi:hypothetical protein
MEISTKANGTMVKRMEMGFFAIIRARYTRVSGRMTYNMAMVWSCGTLIASNTRETLSKARKRAKANLNLRGQLTMVILTRANFTAMANIISQIVGKCMLANLLKTSCKATV